MENRKNDANQLATIGLTSILLIMFFFVVIPEQEASALSRQNVTPPNNFSNILFTKFIPRSNSVVNYLAIANSTSISATSATINVYNSNTTSLIGSINYAGVLGTINAGNNWQFQNISCDKSGNSGLCALSFTSSGSANAVVFMINVYDQTISINATRFTFTNGFIPVVSLFNDGTFTHVYVEFDNAGAGQTHIVKLALNTTQSVSATSNRLVQQADVTSNIRIVGIGNSDTAIVNNGAGAGQWIAFMNSASFQLWSISSASRTCGVNLAGGGNSGDIDYVNDATGSYFLASNQIVNLYKIDFGCNLVTTSAFSAGQIGTGIWSISHDSSRVEVYIVGSNNLIQVVNEATLSTTTLAQYGSVTSPAEHYNNLATNNAYASFQLNNPFVALGGSGHPATIFFIFWQQAGSGGSSNPTASPYSNSPPTANTCNSATPNNAHCVGDIDCDLPANQNIATCVANFGTNPVKGNSQLISTGVNNILVSAGLINGSNTNIKTNGTGYILLIVAILITTAMMLYATKMVLQVPLFVWMFIYIVIVGFAVALQWIDPTFLILGFITMFALGAGKIKSVIAGESQLFG